MKASCSAGLVIVHEAGLARDYTADKNKDAVPLPNSKLTFNMSL